MRNTRKKKKTLLCPKREEKKRERQEEEYVAVYTALQDVMYLAEWHAMWRYLLWRHDKFTPHCQVL